MSQPAPLNQADLPLLLDALDARDEALREMVADYERWLADGCIASLPGTKTRKAIDQARKVLDAA